MFSWFKKKKEDSPVSCYIPASLLKTDPKKVFCRDCRFYAPREDTPAILHYCNARRSRDRENVDYVSGEVTVIKGSPGYVNNEDGECHLYQPKEAAGK
jgi:hypothetical protein